MKRLCASLFCLAFVFAALAHVTVFVGNASGDRAPVAALGSAPAGDGHPTFADIDRPGCAEEADRADGCAIDAVISPLPPLVPLSRRRLANGHEAAAALERNTLSPEPPPPIAVS